MAKKVQIQINKPEEMRNAFNSMLETMEANRQRIKEEKQAKLLPLIEKLESSTPLKDKDIKEILLHILEELETK